MTRAKEQEHGLGFQEFMISTSHDSDIYYFCIHEFKFCGFISCWIPYCRERRQRPREANDLATVQAPEHQLTAPFSILGTGGLKLDHPGGVSGTQEFPMPRNAQTTS